MFHAVFVCVCVCDFVSVCMWNRKRFYVCVCVRVCFCAWERECVFCARVCL